MAAFWVFLVVAALAMGAFTFAGKQQRLFQQGERTRWAVVFVVLGLSVIGILVTGR